MNVMLLAAGEGTRLRPYTETIPKPAVPFLGAPLASYSLGLLENIKIHNLVVNTHHLSGQIEGLFYNLHANCDNLIFSNESSGLLGSGGGIHNAKSALEGRRQFLVMNADEIIIPFDEWLIEDFIRAHHDLGGIATLLTMQHPLVGQKFGGAWTFKNSHEVQIFSKSIPGPEYQGHHFIGAMILKDKIFNYFKNEVQTENILYDTLTFAMKQNEKVFVHDIKCHWEETGNPKDFLNASKTFAKLLIETPEDPAARQLRRIVKQYSKGIQLIEAEDLEASRLVTEALNKISIT